MAMSSVRARLHRLLRRTATDERGLETAEMAIVFPFLLVTLFAFIQGGVWYHGTNLVQASAANAYEAARLYNATSADGINAGTSTAEQAGGMLTNVTVTVERTATDVTATVTAVTPSLLPGVNNTVTKTVTGPVERWVP